MTPELSVVVVNYRSADLVLRALGSLRQETRTHSYELIVVDNDEDGAGAERIEREAPDVRVIRTAGNPGFAVGCNTGMAVGRGRWMLLLNPDTRILDRAVDRCLDFLASPAGAGVAMLGCEHVGEDGSLQPSSFPKVLWPSLLGSLGNNVLLGPLVRALRPDLLEARSVEWQRRLHSRTHDTDALQGSFLIVDRAIVAETGGLDPDFFLYFEELDWCRRVAERGGRIVYYCDARIVHATRRRYDDPRTERQAYLSEALFILKRSGRLACALQILLRHLNVVLGLMALPLMSAAQRALMRKHARLLGFARRHWLRPLFHYAPRFASNSTPLRADPS